MKSVICFLMVVAPLFSAEPPAVPPAPITPAVGQAEMQYNREYNTAKEEFDRKMKLAQDKFITVLKDEMKKLTQRGDLDNAMLVKQKIETLDTAQQAQPAQPRKQPINKKTYNCAGQHQTTIVATGSKPYPNKGYEITSFPEKFDGWTIIKMCGPITLTFTEPTNVALVYDGRRQSQFPDGFEKITDAIMVSDNFQTRNICVKNCSGKLDINPSTWSAFILIESK